MKNKINKIRNYYHYFGFKETVKAILRKIKRKIFKTRINSDYMNFLENQKNFNRNLEELLSDIIPKTGKNIFIFGTVPYFDVGGGQRSAQLAKTYNKMGYSVYYIYAYPCSEENISIMPIPTTYHKFIDDASYEELEDYVKKDDLFIFEAPIKTFDKYVALAKIKNCKIVYENIDNWESSLGSSFFNRNSLELMLKESDMIVSTAKKLVEQTEKYLKEFKIQKNVFYLANAVDDELFDPRKPYELPKDLKKGSKTLLYYGSLWGEWFDWDLLEKIAKSDESLSINLIGDASGIPNIVKAMPKNTHFLGIKKQYELPAYLKYSDYALLPFKPGNICDYVSPLKIFEYVSMEKPVLATNLNDIANYPNVYRLNNVKEWLKKINSNGKLESVRDFIESNNWYHRCTAILDELYKENKEKINSKAYNNLSIVTLNYNNKDVIMRLVDTLLKYNSRYNYEIIVVDNQSSDGSYELLESKYKEKIKLVRNTKNGCSSGRNLGVENAKGDYILFLDSDEWILNSYWLDNYIYLIDNYPEIGAVAWNAGWFNSKGKALKVVDGFEFRYLPPAAIARKDIGYLATCGFIMKKSLFHKIKGFDLKYDPTCYEDTDLSLKIRHAGKEIYYSSCLGVGHLPHQTTKSGTATHTKLIDEKGDYFVEKWTKINKDLIYKYHK